MRIDFAICRCVRTEYGKRIRKLYESHQISEKRGNMTQLEARTDGISNTLTTVQKDNPHTRQVNYGEEECKAAVMYALHLHPKAWGFAVLRKLFGGGAGRYAA